MEKNSMKVYAFAPTTSNVRTLRRSFLGQTTGTCSMISRVVHRRAIRPSLRLQKPCDPRSSSVSMSLLPLVPDWLLISTWLFGAYRFYRGYSRTPYQSSFRVPLAVAWPLLVIFNGSYRQNFVRSIRASEDDF